ncbi:hypothetical protein C0J52_19560 [Blattella germanica]|nr:hypothetical protein C0J52_19560 [Blattella germanica]
MKLIGVLILCMGFFLTGEAEEINQENSCQCAVFDKDQLTADAKLLMKQTLMMDFNCSDDSNATDFCKNVCISLTLAPICEAKKIFMHNIKISCPKKGPCSGTTPAHVSCVCEESCKCECREESTEPENCEDTKHTDTVTSSVPESTEEIQLTGLSSKAPVGGSSKV